jgi:hypothetical protein
MLILHLNSFDPEPQLEQWIDTVMVEPYGKKVTIRETLATGYFKIVTYPNGLKAFMSNYVANQDFMACRGIVDQEYYLLHINQITAKDEFTVLLNNTETFFHRQIYNAVFLTDSKEPYAFKAAKGACFCQLNIMIPKDWMQQYLPHSVEIALLEKYFGLKEERLFFDFFDATYRNLADRVMHTDDSPSFVNITQDIVRLIIERFIFRMNKRIQNKIIATGKSNQKIPGING